MRRPRVARHGQNNPHSTDLAKGRGTWDAQRQVLAPSSTRAPSLDVNSVGI